MLEAKLRPLFDVRFTDEMSVESRLVFIGFEKSDPVFVFMIRKYFEAQAPRLSRRNDVTVFLQRFDHMVSVTWLDLYYKYRTEHVEILPYSSMMFYFSSDSVRFLRVKPGRISARVKYVVSSAPIMGRVKTAGRRK